jgi:hypothetical protein
MRVIVARTPLQLCVPHLACRTQLQGSRGGPLQSTLSLSQERAAPKHPSGKSRAGKFPSKALAVTPSLTGRVPDIRQL